MDTQTLQSFFGWCLLINVGFYVFWVAMMMFAGDRLVRHYVKLFRLDPDRVGTILFQLLGGFKLAILMFSFAPWLAMVIINAR